MPPVVSWRGPPFERTGRLLASGYLVLTKYLGIYGLIIPPPPSIVPAFFWCSSTTRCGRPECSSARSVSWPSSSCWRCLRARTRNSRRTSGTWRLAMTSLPPARPSGGLLRKRVLSLGVRLDRGVTLLDVRRLFDRYPLFNKTALTSSRCALILLE